MTGTAPEDIRRLESSAIDTAFYVAKGRKARSVEAYRAVHLGGQYVRSLSIVLRGFIAKMAPWEGLVENMKPTTSRRVRWHGHRSRAARMTRSAS